MRFHSGLSYLCLPPRFMEESAELLRKREALAESLRHKGITDDRVLQAIRNLPRHAFLPEHLLPVAYEDRPLPIEAGQTISQPYTVAYQLQLLSLAPTHSVLEIGTGSGYCASLLSLLADEVFSIERQRKLFEQNRDFPFLRERPNLFLFYGDGYEGLPSYAPFDRILITAAAPDVPPRLIEQLKPGGLLVLPLGREKPQKMVRLSKDENGSLHRETFDNFSFVPMLEGME